MSPFQPAVWWPMADVRSFPFPDSAFCVRMGALLIWTLNLARSGLRPCGDAVVQVTVTRYFVEPSHHDRGKGRRRPICVCAYTSRLLLEHHGLPGGRKSKAAAGVELRRSGQKELDCPGLACRRSTSTTCPFSIVPLVVNIVRLFWNCYLSYVNSQGGAAKKLATQ